MVVVRAVRVLEGDVPLGREPGPRALYFRQATNGLFVRMALLTMLWD